MLVNAQGNSPRRVATGHPHVQSPVSGEKETKDALDGKGSFRPSLRQKTNPLKAGAVSPPSPLR